MIHDYLQSSTAEVNVDGQNCFDCQVFGQRQVFTDVFAKVDVR